MTEAMNEMGLRWEHAYYPTVNREDFTVEEALRVRAEHAGEYRENPCYNSKKAYEEDLGIKLTPCDFSNSNTSTINHFRAFPNQQVLAQITASVGIRSSSSAKYSDSGIRVKQVIDFLLTELGGDRIAVQDMLILSVVSGKISSVNHPDIIIRHRGDYHRRETRIFVQDKGRSPQYDELVDDWFLDITKFSPSLIMSWRKMRPLFMKEFKKTEARMRRKKASILEEQHLEEARRTLTEIMKDVYSDQESFPELHLVEQAIQLRIDNGDISKSIGNSARALYLKENQGALFVDGNGISRVWHNGSEVVGRGWQSSYVEGQ